MRRAASAIACISLVFGSCAEEGDGATHEGRVSSIAESGPSGRRWVITVQLDRHRVAGSETVQVAFDRADVACADGTPLSPEQIEVAAEVTFIRVGDDAEMMEPPAIGGESVVVSC